MLRAQLGFWLANATHDSEFVNDVGLAERLAPLGIHAIAHGYLFDTILKGWLIRPLHQHADLSQTVLGQLGPAGAHFRDTSSRASFYSDTDLLGMLSKDGKQLAITQLRGTAASLEPVSDGRLDITFERHVLPSVSEQLRSAVMSRGWKGSTCRLRYFIRRCGVGTGIAAPRTATWGARTGVRWSRCSIRRSLFPMRIPVLR